MKLAETGPKPWPAYWGGMWESRTKLALVSAGAGAASQPSPVHAMIHFVLVFAGGRGIVQAAATPDQLRVWDKGGRGTHSRWQMHCAKVESLETLWRLESLDATGPGQDVGDVFNVGAR
ncbi:hypothetical protein E4U17_007420 [Claviceps sp. LM77 group G4]|nr:hypothetical protein E4U17_007420 [Claviceps sp. LM77 group G4]KAG6060393.1 hypothetical protein E4U33_006946 [Claviceps sp. LM78 group G4]